MAGLSARACIIAHTCKFMYCNFVLTIYRPGKFNGEMDFNEKYRAYQSLYFIIIFDLLIYAYLDY